MGEQGELAAQVRALIAEAAVVADGTDLEPEVARIATRLDEPLRVAIAGRAKAGKSTLLNALVGERLAATDAGECTKIVTWYRHALGYRVTAQVAGIARELPFRRREGRLDIEFDGLTPHEVERLDVGWPSRRLADLTLIDTPGLAGSDAAISARTTDALIGDEQEGPGQADGVIYLMRHLHHRDGDFLEAFLDRSIGQASPINAVVVLSRADEIGAGRLDALDSARVVAERYARDPRIRSLASAVVPVGGLIAETGVMLQERQVAWLRELAAVPVERRERLLLSVDRFRAPNENPLGEAIREELLERLGMYGLRLAVSLIAEGRATTATALSRALVAASGIETLQRVIAEQFGARAETLKSRSAFIALRGIANELDRRGVAGATALVSRIEQIEAGSQALALLRLLHLVLAGLVRMSPEERAEIERLTNAGAANERLGLAPDADSDAVRAAAIEGIERWRGRAGNPLSDRATVEAAEIVVRAYEAVFVDA